MHLLQCCSVFLATFCCVYGSSSTFYTDNDLGQSVPVGRLDKRQKKAMKQEILQLMGLYSMPKRRTKLESAESASDFMQRLYKSITDDETSREEGLQDSYIHIDRNFNASGLGLDLSKVEGCDTIVSFANKANKVPHLRHEKDRTFYFDFSEVSVGEHIKGGELRLYKEVADKEHSGPFLITAYRIKQGRDWEDKVLEEVGKQTVSWDTQGWLSIDVTRAAEEWAYFPFSNMGLYLKITDSYDRESEPRRVGLVGRSGAPNKQPFLVGYMRMSQAMHRRSIRSIRNLHSSQSTSFLPDDHNPYTIHSRQKRSSPRILSNTVCQRHNLYINFTEIGFHKEILLAPEGYRAFVCAGQCSFPLGIHMNSTNHAIVQTLIHLDKSKEIPKPCCSATQYHSFKLLYRNEENTSIIVRLFAKMIVAACGCK